MKTKMTKILSVMMAVALVIAGSFVVSSDAKAAEIADSTIAVGEVKYVKYDAADCKPGKEAPVYSGADADYGYLFGGWYTQDGDKWAAIANETQKEAAGTDIYAKFVPAYVLSVKCQSFAGTQEDSESTALRVLSSVDCEDYQKVGFNLSKIVKDGDTYTETMMGTDGTQETTKTYAKFALYTSQTDASPKEYTPAEVFGAASKYLTAWKVNKIPNAHFGTIICIKPYWVTPDGVQVFGLAKYAHVEDGYLNYINVPVNLNNVSDVAAGMLDVAYDSAKLTFVEAEYGRVFEEMEWNAAQAGVVKLVGNVEDITKNAASDDVYVNLRFKAAAGADFTTGSNAFDFNVTGENFTNINEELLTGTAYNVWNVKAAILK